MTDAFYKDKGNLPDDVMGEMRQRKMRGYYMVRLLQKAETPLNIDEVITGWFNLYKKKITRYSTRQTLYHLKKDKNSGVVSAGWGMYKMRKVR